MKPAVVGSIDEIHPFKIRECHFRIFRDIDCWITDVIKMFDPLDKHSRAQIARFKAGIDISWQDGVGETHLRTSEGGCGKLFENRTWISKIAVDRHHSACA